MSERTTDELIEALEKWRKEAPDARQWAVFSPERNEERYSAEARGLSYVKVGIAPSAREALAKLCEELAA